jgi:fibronectin-binding autotransporter adhesin
MKTHTIIRLLASACLATLPASLQAATITWNNTGTDFNSASSWTEGSVPGSADNATFNATAATQPELTGALTLQGLTFSGVSGYTLSSTGSAFTLTNTGTGVSTTAIYATNTTGTNSISAPIILGGAAATTSTFNQFASGTLVISGNISSANAITGLSLRGGSGTQITLSGNNTYAGSTTLFSSGITLNINSATAISSGNLVLNANTNIDNTTGSALTLSNNNNISLNNGSLTFVGTNNLSFGSGTATISGANRSITTTAGTLTIGSLDADLSSRNFTKSGASTLVLSNAAGATYGGITTITAGTLEIGNNASLGSTGNITFAGTGATLRYGVGVDADLSSRIKNSTSTLRIDTGANTVTFASSLETTNTTAFDKFGSGTLVLTGSNSYTGATNISEGILRINTENSLGSGQLRLQGGVLGLGSGDFTRPLATGVGSVTIQQDGSGFAAFGANRTVNIGGAGAQLGWGTTSNFFNTNGSRMVLNVDQSDATLTLANALSLGNNATRTIEVGDGSAAVDAIITGIVSQSPGSVSNLIKSGHGLLQLDAANTYSGTTTVSAGTLLVGGSIANSATTVASGASLRGSGTTGTVNVSAGGILAPGHLTPGVLNTQSLNLAGNLQIRLDSLVAGTGYDQVSVTGTVTLDATSNLSLTLGFTPSLGDLFFLVRNDGSDSITGLLAGHAQDSVFNMAGQDWRIGYTGDFTTSAFTGGNDLVIQAVPEPSTIGLALLGLAAAALLRKRLRPRDSKS